MQIEDRDFAKSVHACLDFAAQQRGRVVVVTYNLPSEVWVKGAFGTVNQALRYVREEVEAFVRAHADDLDDGVYTCPAWELNAGGTLSLYACGAEFELHFADYTAAP